MTYLSALVMVQLKGNVLPECVCMTPERYIPTGPDPFCRDISELPCRPPEDKDTHTHTDCYLISFPTSLCTVTTVTNPTGFAGRQNLFAGLRFF